MIHFVTELITLWMAVAGRIAETYNAIKQDGLRDWRKLFWEHNTKFRAARNWLTSFVGTRNDFLRDEMKTFCPTP
jgi:hypothetical protein